STLLRRKCAQQVLDFLINQVALQANKHVRRAEIAIVFGNLVFQDQVIAERIPGQFGNQPMILVRVPTIVGQDEIRGELLLLLFESIFDRTALVWQETISKRMQDDARVRQRRQECRGALLRLVVAIAAGGEHHPPDLQRRVLPYEAQDRSAAAYL